MYYVYLHRRKDNNEIFYVGKGKGLRAWNKYNRSNHWKSVTKKYGYLVEIVINNIQEWYAFELEKEYILKYKNNGYLINHTDGGEGISGYKHTKENNSRQSIMVAGLNNPKADTTIYEFLNIHTNEIIKSTRYEFEDRYKISVKDLFKNKTFNVNGWCLFGSKIKSNKIDMTHYTFLHLSGEIFVGTRVMFKKKYGICLKNLFNKNNRTKSVKGWGIL